jgi:tetratricopeptide (TPR) repeat protein
LLVNVVGLRGLVERRRAERALLEGRRHVGERDLAGAERTLREALASARASGSANLVIAAGGELYQVLLRRRYHDEAVPVLQEVVRRHVEAHGPDGDRTAAWRNELILLLGQLGRYADVEQACRDRLAAATRLRDGRGIGSALVTLAWCMRGLGRWDEAEQLCREAVAHLDACSGGLAQASWALAGLAAVLQRRLRMEEAEAALVRAIDAWGAVGRGDMVSAAQEQLLDLYVAWERYPDALRLSEVRFGRVERHASAAADRERRLRNIERHAFLLRIGGRADEASRYESRAGYLRQAIEAQPQSSDGGSWAADPSGPVFDGEPTFDWALPGAAVAARAC